MKKQGNMIPSRKPNKSLKTDHKEMDIHKLLDKRLKIAIIKMPSEIRKAMHEQNENNNQDTENINKTN